MLVKAAVFFYWLVLACIERLWPFIKTRAKYGRFRRRIEKLLLPNHSTASVVYDANFPESDVSSPRWRSKCLPFSVAFFSQKFTFRYEGLQLFQSNASPNLTRNSLPFPTCAWTALTSNIQRPHPRRFEWYPTSSFILLILQARFALHHFSHLLHHYNAYCTPSFTTFLDQINTLPPFWTPLMPAVKRRSSIQPLTQNRWTN